MIAITRKVSPSIDQCELVHLDRQTVDYETARSQHEEYEKALRNLGCEVISLGALAGFPDSVFVEDTSVVLDEVAIAMRPGAESRRGEVESVVSALRPFRRIERISEPATIDGGDVLRIDRTLWIGLSQRTSRDAVEQLRKIVSSRGYEVRSIEVTHCLHLKSGVSYIRGASGEPMLLINPDWIDPDTFGGIDTIEVDPGEPSAANVISVGSTVLASSAFPATKRRMESRGIRVVTVDATELAKAESGLTCCSLLFDE